MMPDREDPALSDIGVVRTTTSPEKPTTRAAIAS